MKAGVQANLGMNVNVKVKVREEFWFMTSNNMQAILENFGEANIESSVEAVNEFNDESKTDIEVKATLFTRLSKQIQRIKKAWFNCRLYACWRILRNGVPPVDKLPAHEEVKVEDTVTGAVELKA